MTHDEIIDGLHMASGIVQNRQALLHGKTHGRDMSPTELCLDSSYTSAINACAAASTEIQRLAAQLAEIEAQEPVAWIEHELSGSGERHLHFERRPKVLRDEVIAPVWTALIPHPVPAAEPVLGVREVVCRCRRCLTERGDSTPMMIVCPTCGNKRCPHATDHRHACTGSNEPGQPGSYYGDMQDEPATAAAPERAEPAANELPTPCTECGQLGRHKFGCSHVAHERGLRVTAQSSDSTSCPRGER